MAAKMALLGNTQFSNNGQGFVLPFPQIFQVAAPQLINSVKVTACAQALLCSFVQASPAAQSLALQQTEEKAQQ